MAAAPPIPAGTNAGEDQQTLSASNFLISTGIANAFNFAVMLSRAGRHSVSPDSHLAPVSRNERKYFQVFGPAESRKYLTLDWKQAFHDWTGDKYYNEINQALRDDNKAGLEKLGHQIQSIRRAVKQMRTSKAAILYRGTNITEEIARRIYKVGASFLLPEFTASSTSKKVARHFSKMKNNGYILNITTPGIGTSYYAKIPKEWSQYPGEKEVLIYPYTGITVLAVDHQTREIQVSLKDTLIVEREAGFKLGSCGGSSSWPSGKP